jgi:hypothetical protein
VGEGDRVAAGVVKVKHGVHRRAEAAALDGGRETLTDIELDGEGINVAGLFQTPVDRYRERVDRLCLRDLVVGV